MRQRTHVASVLVIAVDPNIEALMGQLLTHAGHRPSYDATLGAAGEAIRRIRPDVVLLDTDLPRSVVRACRDAAAENDAKVILTSSSSSQSELADEARRANCPYFALPGGPVGLRDLIRRALAVRDNGAHVDSKVMPGRSEFRPDP